MNDRYILIPGWLLGNNSLSHTEIVVCAAIYGFCQDEKSDYHGGLEYLCQLTKIQRKESMSRILNRLVAEGYLTRYTEMLLKGKKEYHYRICRKRFEGGELTASQLTDSQHPVDCESTTPLTASQPDNKIDNKIDKKERCEARAGENENENENENKGESFLEWWKLYGKKGDQGRCYDVWQRIDDRTRVFEHTRQYIAETLPRYRRNPFWYLYNKMYEQPLETNRNDTRTSPANEPRDDEDAIRRFLEDKGDLPKSESRT